LDESFEFRQWRLERRRQALKDTKFEFNLRSYYFDRSDFNGSEKQAWAIGGWLGVKTGYFLDHIAFGATVYTSNPIYAPDDRDGKEVAVPSPTPAQDVAAIKYGLGYFYKIKERNDSEFVSMSEDAGADVERGVWAAGALYEKGKFSIGAIDYYSDDIINIAYA